MKKVIIILLCILLVTACKKNPVVKELTCAGDIEGNKTTYVLKVNDTVKKLESVKMIMDISLEQYTDEQIEAVKKVDFCKSESITKYDLKSCDVKIENKNLNVVADFNEENYMEEGAILTSESLKNAFESGYGFKCTVK